MSALDVQKLADIAMIEFVDIVTAVLVPDINEMRIFLKDGSFADIWFSLKLPNRYSYHWDRRIVDGTIYRFDNSPHLKWSHVSSFPDHFHNGSEANVTSSPISHLPDKGLRDFLTFVKGTIKK